MLRSVVVLSYEQASAWHPAPGLVPDSRPDQSRQQAMSGPAEDYHWDCFGIFDIDIGNSQ